MRQQKPCAVCTVCGHVSYSLNLINGPCGRMVVSVWATHPFLPLRLVVHLSYERSWSVAEAA
jgi:hypothetical protein